MPVRNLRLRTIHNFMLEHGVFMTHRVVGGYAELDNFEEFKLLVNDPEAFHKKWDVIITEAEMKGMYSPVVIRHKRKGGAK